MKNNINLKKIKLSTRTTFLLLLSIVCFASIIWNSSRTGEESKALSDGISNSIKDKVEENHVIPPTFQGTGVINSTASEEDTSGEISVNMYQLNIFIRKLGHLLEYGLFSFLVSLTFISHGVKKDSAFFLALVINTAVASTDEFIQSKTSGRSGRITDIFIDTSGGIIGAFLAICVFLVLYYWILELKKANKGEKCKKICEND